MPYAIDGHNLIAQIPGWSLADPDDETRLVNLVAGWASRRRVSATIFFDRGSAGHPSTTKKGRLTLRFARHPRTADEAIEDMLAQLGRGARAWTVVSSDRAIQDAARRAGARTLTSREFAADLASGVPITDEKPASSDPDDISRWLDEFRKRRTGRGP